MRKHMLRILSVAVLIFAASYFVWQHGRMVGQEEGRTERGDYIYMNCTPTLENPDELECQMWELNTPKAIKAFKKYSELYQQVLDEIRHPSEKQDWIREYEERESRKLGL